VSQVPESGLAADLASLSLQRVVDGYRRMQTASDIFLGWSQGPKRHSFIRQPRDLKVTTPTVASQAVDLMQANRLGLNQR
jgi:hypothetical protein